MGKISRNTERSQIQLAALHPKVNDLQSLLVAIQSSLDDTSRAHQASHDLLEASIDRIVQNQQLQHQLLAADAVEPLRRLEEAAAATTMRVQQAVERLDPVTVALARVEESNAKIEGFAHSLRQLLISGESHINIHAATQSERRQAVCSPAISITSLSKSY